MKTRKIRLILLAAALCVSIFCAYMLDWGAFNYVGNYETKMEESAVFTDGHEAFDILGCEIVDKKVHIIGADPQFAVPASNEEVMRVRIVFSEPVEQDTPFQLFYSLPGVYFSEEYSKTRIIFAETTETSILIPKAIYSFLRFDFDKDVSLDTIYNEYVAKIYYEYRPDTNRIILLSFEIFIMLGAVILIFTRNKQSDDKL